MKFETCDEGLIVRRADETTLARVTTVQIVEPTTTDRNGAVVYLPREIKPLAKADWVMHFTGVKMTLEEVGDLLEALKAHS